MNQIQTKPLCASLSNLADMLTMVNPIDFGGHSSKVKVTISQSIIDKCGVHGDTTLCIVIFLKIFTILLPSLKFPRCEIKIHIAVIRKYE